MGIPVIHVLLDILNLEIYVVLLSVIIVQALALATNAMMVILCLTIFALLVILHVLSVLVALLIVLAVEQDLLFINQVAINHARVKPTVKV